MVIIKLCLLVLSIFCISCTRKPKTNPASISLTNNKHSIKFSGLDPAVLGEISRDSVSDVWEVLIPVYAMPSDTNLKDYQSIQHGRYLVQNSLVVFTPDTPFIAGKTYFMRYYHFAEMNDLNSFIRQKKRLGSVPYIDLIFK